MMHRQQMTQTTRIVMGLPMLTTLMQMAMTAATTEMVTLLEMQTVMVF